MSRALGQRQPQKLFKGHITEEEAQRFGKRCQLAPMTPYQVAIFLGYTARKERSGKPNAAWMQRFEAAVTEWLPVLGLEAWEQCGKTNDSAKAPYERYVEFRVAVPNKPAAFTPRPGAECVAYCEWPRRAPWKPANPVKYARRSRTPKFGGAA